MFRVGSVCFNWKILQDIFINPNLKDCTNIHLDVCIMMLMFKDIKLGLIASCFVYLYPVLCMNIYSNNLYKYKFAKYTLFSRHSQNKLHSIKKNKTIFVFYPPKASLTRG